MKKTSKYKVNLWLFIVLVIFLVISLITINSAQNLIPHDNLVIKQLLWYSAGFILIYFIMFIGNDLIYRSAWILYGIGILSLIALLIFAPTINDAQRWFVIPGIGSIQPSEFMKIFLIIVIGTMIHKFNEHTKKHSLKDEFIFLLKIAVVVGIPSVLTLLQPDTGSIFIYLIITFTMLFIAGIRYRWFLIIFAVLGISIGSILIIYFNNVDLFIKIFGTDFFLRVDRLLDWSNQSGFQLENSMVSIGTGGALGMGPNNTPIYFPEPQTDFIFAVFANNFGFLGSTFLVGIFVFFNVKLIQLAGKTTDLTNKYILAGLVGMLIYQQLQNIGMTFGIMPITGITLPFISYGGSSLLSYMVMMGIIFNISNSTIRYSN